MSAISTPPGPSSGTVSLSDRPRLAVRELLASDDTYATVLLILCLDRYGLSCLKWHPHTFRLSLNEDFGADVTPANIGRLMAAIAIVTTDLFFTDLDAFIRLCNVLAGDELDPTTFDWADALECAWGITEALLLYPPDTPEPFNDDIRHYLAFTLKEGGYVTAPDVLRLALGHTPTLPVPEEYGDDPEMFSAMYKNQQRKAEEVTTVLSQCMHELMGQLEQLPLEHGDSKPVRAILERTMHRAV